MSEVNQTIFNNLKEFIYKQADRIIRDVIGTQAYDPIYAKQLIDKVCTEVITKLSSTNKNFKYITNCILMPKGSHGLDMGGLSSWDPEMDGSVTVKWDNDGIICILCIYGISV